MRSSSVTPSCNANFLDLLEDYFAQPTEKLQEDERPEFSYQAGATLANTEKPKCHSNDECQAVIAQLDVNERPLDLNAEFADPKCRVCLSPLLCLLDSSNPFLRAVLLPHGPLPAARAQLALPEAQHAQCRAQSLPAVGRNVQ